MYTKNCTERYKVDKENELTQEEIEAIQEQAEQDYDFNTYTAPGLIDYEQGSDNE